MTRVSSKDSLIDQYYTRNHIVDICVDKIYENCDLSNCTLIDTSCGNNYFGYKLGIEHYVFDISLPKNIHRSDKTKQISNENFLNSNLPKFDKTIMGFNPPYGLRNMITKKFLTKIFNYKPTYIALILLKPTSTQWNIPGYKILFKQDLPVNSFVIQKNIPTEFIIWEFKTHEPITSFLPRAKIQKFKHDIATISRSKTYNVRHWCSIAIRYCGVNAGAHYYIFHHNNIYFHDYNKNIHQKVDKTKHKIPNVFTVVNFNRNLTKESLEKIVLFCFGKSSQYINTKALRYNFNTSDVVKIFRELV